MPLNFSDHAPSTVQYDHLLDALTGSLCELQPLLDRLKCSLDALEQALDSPQLEQHLRVQTKLAFCQSRLIATATLPKLTLKLVALADSDKPEVARRAINSLREMAQPPAPPQPPAPEKASLLQRPDPEPPPASKIWDPDSLAYAADNLRSLKLNHNIDLGCLHFNDIPLLAEQIQKFIHRSRYGLIRHPAPPASSAHTNQSPEKQALSSPEAPVETSPDLLLPDPPAEETSNAHPATCANLP